MPEGAQIDYLDDRPADVPRLWVDPTKLKSLIGQWSLKDFDEGLQETIAYYRELSKSQNLSEEITLLNWKK